MHNSYLIGFTKSSLLRSIDSGIVSQRKKSPQLNPPLTRGEDSYSNVSWLIMSMIGIATLCRLALMCAKSGSSHPSFTSQWLSKNTRTCQSTPEPVNQSTSISTVNINQSTSSQSFSPSKALWILTGYTQAQRRQSGLKTGGVVGPGLKTGMSWVLKVQ